MRNDSTNLLVHHLAHQVPSCCQHHVTGHVTGHVIGHVICCELGEVCTSDYTGEIVGPSHQLEIKIVSCD